MATPNGRSGSIGKPFSDMTANRPKAATGYSRQD